MAVDSSTLLFDGPWRHRFVAANGARFHVAVAGPEDRETPLVVLLHGVPQFWWAWRHQVPALAEAGYRVAAMDVRGAGASDKPPLGYDVPTLTRDVAGVVRSLGAAGAAIVGHGIGGEIAWAMPALQPAVTLAVGAVSAAHPLHARAHRWSGLRPGTARHLAYFQLPTLPERALNRTDLVARLLREWGAGGWPPPDVAATYAAAAQVPFAAHSAMEQVRWSVRSQPRPDGRRYAAALRAAPAVPTLQLHGVLDGCRPERSARATGEVAALLGDAYRYQAIDGAGHFLPEEAPDAVTELLLEWLAEVLPLAP